MKELGTIKGNEIKVNRDSKETVRIANSEVTQAGDTQSIELITPSGEDFKPEKEDVVLIIPISTAYKMGIIVDDGVIPDSSLEEGEKEIYSKAGGVKLAKIKLSKDSEIILNDGADFAVKFNELQTKLEALRIQLQTHVHPGVAPGGSSTGPTPTPFDTDISSAKVDKVKL